MSSSSSTLEDDGDILLPSSDEQHRKYRLWAWQLIRPQHVNCGKHSFLFNFPDVEIVLSCSLIKDKSALSLNGTIIPVFMMTNYLSKFSIHLPMNIFSTDITTMEINH